MHATHRRPLTTLLLLLALVALAPALVRADEPPEPAPDAPGDAPDDAPGKAAEAPLTPYDAWQEIRDAVAALPRAQRTPAYRTKATAWIDAWKKVGGTAEGRDRRYLGLLEQMAERWSDALASHRAVQADEALETGLRDGAASAESSLLGRSVVRAADGDENVSAALTRLLAHAATMEGEPRAALRGSIRMNVANVLDALERRAEALEVRMALVMEQPALTSRLTRSIVRGLLASSHGIESADTARAAAGPILVVLRHQQARAVELAEAKAESARAALRESSPDSLDERGALKEKDRRKLKPAEMAYYNAERAVRGAQGALRRLDTAGRPFELLGRPAPAWTLEHAFGDCAAISDLRGQVVVLDFWATWCGWCVRSFPAIRDLLRDYAGRDLVVVGVTASSGNVYEHRYSLDDDLKDRIVDGQGSKLGARMASGSRPADGKLVLEPDAYRAREREVIATFMKNHEMTWPVVMIDKTEPGPKFALTGWPHAVVLDRQGRVRYFKSGALLRDKPEAVAAFRKVLDELLAEPAPGVGR